MIGFGTAAEASKLAALEESGNPFQFRIPQIERDFSRRTALLRHENLFVLTSRIISAHRHDLGFREHKEE